MMHPVNTNEQIEVKWLLEVRVKSGRSKGKLKKQVVWWKALVTSVELIQKGVMGELCYDANYGIDQTKMRARFIGGELQHVGDGCANMPHQKWRRHRKKPGARHSDSVTVERDFRDDRDCTTTSTSPFNVAHGGIRKSRKPKSSVHLITARVCELEMKLDQLHRLVSAQSAIYSRTVGTESEFDRVADRVFRYLRHKMVHRCNRHFSLPRQKSAISEVLKSEGRFVGVCFTTVLRVDVNCSLSEFAKIAMVIRARCPNATFEPSFCEAQSPTQTLEEGRVLFDSLHDVSKCIKFGAQSDLVALVVKGRKINGAELAEDCALRLIGGTLAENEDDVYPSFFRLAGSLHQALPDTVVDLLRRENRRFDYGNSMFANRLELSSMSTHQALSESGITIDEEEDLRCGGDSAFSLRWCRLPSQYGKNLPKSGHGQDEVLGKIELSWPALIVRSRQVVAEFQAAITQEMLGRV